MNKKQTIGLVVAAGLFIIIGISSVLTNTFSQKALDKSMKDALSLTGGMEFDAPKKDYIAIVNVVGTIEQQAELGIFDEEQSYQHVTTLDYIDRLINDKNNKGMLLYVDSPGGTVYESEELYQKLQEYKQKTGRPIWDYMAHYAASGGYMVSMPADKIYANPNTTTGSIGVIMSGFDLTGLYEKLGMRYISITSGKNKDSSKMTEEQIEIYQSQINECYEDFVGKVSEGRNMSVEEVKVLADGRTYTAKQAKENGLIDEISLFADMKADMSQEMGVYEFYQPKTKDKILSQLFTKVSGLVPKSEAQILKETAEEKESGVLMYYAEQLQ
ncbi:MAG: signal peptide peptidase SppA [Dorea sp.]|jgi:protease-4|nr:signal peptide peptidase SppA [Dorea sp.]